MSGFNAFHASGFNAFIDSGFNARGRGTPYFVVACGDRGTGVTGANLNAWRLSKNLAFLSGADLVTPSGAVDSLHSVDMNINGDSWAAHNTLSVADYFTQQNSGSTTVAWAKQPGYAPYILEQNGLIYAVGGRNTSVTGTFSSAWLLNTSGTVLAQLDPDSASSSSHVSMMSDGDVLISNHDPVRLGRYSADLGTQRYLVDISGELSANASVVDYGTTSDPEGNAYIGGAKTGGATEGPRIAKYDPSGNLLWVADCSDGREGDAVRLAYSRGSVYASIHPGFSGRSVWKVNATTGTEEWVKDLATGASFGIAAAPDGTLFGCGVFTRTVFRFDADGNILNTFTSNDGFLSFGRDVKIVRGAWA